MNLSEETNQENHYQQDFSLTTAEDSEEILHVLTNLTENLRAQYISDSFEDEIKKLKERQEEIMIRIQNIAFNLLKDIVENQSVIISLYRNSWKNCTFGNQIQKKSKEDCLTTKIKLTDSKSLFKFSALCFVMGKVFTLLKTQQMCSKREFYYRNTDIFNTQSNFDNVLNDLSRLLEAPIFDLNIYSASKGLIYGLVILKTSAETDCSTTGGTLIPNDVSNTVEIKSKAKFVLLIEKETVFKRLLEDNVMRDLPECILITGKGFPDINTRILLKKMWDILSIPILALVDPDPWGIEIMSIYRFGSLNMSHSSLRLAVPAIRWLGVFPSEICTLDQGATELTPRDSRRLQLLLQRPYDLPQRFADELHFASYKAEIEHFDTPRGYLAHKYIPNKIAAGDFI